VMRIDGWEAVAPGERSGGLDRTRICDLLRVKNQRPRARAATQRYGVGGNCWKERAEDYRAGFTHSGVKLRSRR